MDDQRLEFSTRAWLNAIGLHTFLPMNRCTSYSYFEINLNYIADWLFRLCHVYDSISTNNHPFYLRFSIINKVY